MKLKSRLFSVSGVVDFKDIWFFRPTYWNSIFPEQQCWLSIRQFCHGLKCHSPSWSELVNFQGKQFCFFSGLPPFPVDVASGRNVFSYRNKFSPSRSSWLFLGRFCWWGKQVGSHKKLHPFERMMERQNILELFKLTLFNLRIMVEITGVVPLFMVICASDFSWQEWTWYDLTSQCRNLISCLINSF